MLNLLKQTKIQILIIAVLTILAYSNSLKNGLVWDDHLFLEQWPDIQTGNISEILRGSAPPGQGKIFRPVRGVIYAVDYKFFGANASAYHLQALLIHLASTILVFFITKQLFLGIEKNYESRITNHGKKHDSLFMLHYSPFVVALLFGLHPIHTETIDYIAASMETFGTLFFFGSFYLYLLFRHPGLDPGSSVQGSKLDSRLRGNDKRKEEVQNFRVFYYIASVILAILAFFTYEMTLTLPLLIALYELCHSGLSRIPKKKDSGVFASLIPRMTEMGGVMPYFIGAGIFMAIRFSVLGLVSRTDYLGYSFYATMLTMVKVFVQYIGLMILPINLTAIHNLVGDFPASMIPYDSLKPILSQSIVDSDVIVSILIIVIMVITAIKIIRRQPLISFSILWFFIALLPVSYIIPHGGAMAEKYLYIASFGFILGSVYLVFVIASVAKQSWSSLITAKIASSFFLAMTIVVALSYSVLTYQRNTVWANDVTLFADVVKKSPSNLIANYTLGIWLTRYGHFDEAVAAYKRAIEKAPEFWEARFNLGNIYLRSENYDLATEQYQSVGSLQPKFAAVKNIMSNLQLIKESSPSAQRTEELMVNYKSGSGLRFSFPASWEVKENQGMVTLSDSGELPFKVEMSREELKKQVFDDYVSKDSSPDSIGASPSGTLVNQGLAQIPNVDKAFVKVFQATATSSAALQPGTGQVFTKLEFYLLKGASVIKILVSPAESPLMRMFDVVVGSLEIK